MHIRRQNSKVSLSQALMSLKGFSPVLQTFCSLRCWVNRLFWSRLLDGFDIEESCFEAETSDDFLKRSACGRSWTNYLKMKDLTVCSLHRCENQFLNNNIKFVSIHVLGASFNYFYVTTRSISEISKHKNKKLMFRIEAQRGQHVFTEMFSIWARHLCNWKLYILYINIFMVYLRKYVLDSHSMDGCNRRTHTFIIFITEQFGQQQ